jgi:hypothetical protein
MIPSTIPLVGLATRSVNALRLLLLGLLVLTRGRWTKLVITMRFSMWVLIEFEGGPLVKTLFGECLLLVWPIVHSESQWFQKLDECVAVSGSVKI